jgi:hypothetical protein
MTQTRAQSDIGRWSTAAAIFACTCNLILTNYLIYAARGRSFDMSYPELVNECIWLAPILVVIIFRRLTPVTFIYSLPLFIVLADRIYHVVQFHLFGPSTLPRFTWADLFEALLGMFSLIVVLIWAISCLANFIFDAVKRIIGAGRDG